MARADATREDCVEQDARRLFIWASCDVRKRDEEALESGASLEGWATPGRLRRTACLDRVARRFGLEDDTVEVEWPRVGFDELGRRVGEFGREFRGRKWAGQ